jgi:quinoprotein dehydrogenase-associated probable ABC transporter substrate-binding protein
MVTTMGDKLYGGVAFLVLGLVSWLGVAQLPEQGAHLPAEAVETTSNATALQEADELRVCADPNNLPFSNRAEEGFHNRLAELFAEEMGLSSVSYTWWRQHRGFVRNTLKENKCDVIFGVPEGYDILQSTTPFYRSPYVFLYRADADFEVSSLDDPVLRDLQIGVNLIGDDYMNPPPAHALGARGIVSNVKGFTVYGDYDEDSPPKDIVYAVASGDVELAIVWGPVAGYWSQRQDVPLEMKALPAVDDSTGFPLAYNMSLGVRRGEGEWQARLEKVIEENQEEIYRILEEEFHVPLLPIERGGQGASGEDDGRRESSRGGAGPTASLGSPYGASGGPRAPMASRGASSPAPSAEAALAAVSPADLVHAPPAAVQDTPVSRTVYTGWRQFMVHCVRCHGEAGTGTTIAPGLLQAVNREGFTPDSFTITVMQGRPDKGMPAWNALLNDEKANAIYEYIVARTEGLPAGRPEAPPADEAPSEDDGNGAEGDEGQAARGGDEAPSDRDEPVREPTDPGADRPGGAVVDSSTHCRDG